MEFTNTFTIPVGVAEAFTTLTDLEQVAPCMPGAKLETVEGDVYTGRVKVKVGPMSLTYRGTAELVAQDPEAHTARIEARGNEARGGGTASADVSASLVEVADGTEVTVVTNLDITGKPAQFGRGVMGDVGKKIIDAFADCLSGRFQEPEEEAEPGEEAAAAAAADAGAAGGPTEDLGGGEAGATPASDAVAAPSAPTAAQVAAASVQDAGVTAETAAAEPASTGPRHVADTEPEVEALDLMDVAGGSIAKRALPAIGVLALVALVAWLFTRRRHDD